MTERNHDASDVDTSQVDTAGRRPVLTWLSRFALVGGLVASYGTLAAFMGRFLYPARDTARGWLFVAEVDRLKPGDSLVYRAPSGATVNIARQGQGTMAEDFIALSSTCPHLGCQVHWEAQNDRFFCPCHNGIFTPSGEAIGGPPAEANQSLPRFPLKVEQDLLYIEVPLDRLADAETGETNGAGEVIEHPWRAPGPGHDPCLAPRSVPSQNSLRRS